MRHKEYLERQAARAARDDVVKPKKFEHEVRARHTAGDSRAGVGSCAIDLGTAAAE